MESDKQKNKNKILIPTSKIKESVKCENTKDAYKIFKHILRYEKYELKSQEHFWIMGIDSEEYVVCIYIAAIGANNRQIIDPVDMFATAINHNSKKIVLAHNHPDVNESPYLSNADFDLTNRLYHACLPFGIEIIDHLILADDTYYSLDENEYMNLIHTDWMYKTYQEIKPKIDRERKYYGDDKRAEGKEEGLKQGKIAIVKSMLKNNEDISKIIKYTGLSKEEIENIIK